MQFLGTVTPTQSLIDNGPPAGFEALNAREFAYIREIYIQGILRASWQRADKPGAFMLFEAASAEALQAVVDAFPLVAAGMIQFDLAPLKPSGVFGPRD